MNHLNMPAAASEYGVATMPPRGDVLLGGAEGVAGLAGRAAGGVPVDDELARRGLRGIEGELDLARRDAGGREGDVAA